MMVRYIRNGLSKGREASRKGKTREGLVKKRRGTEQKGITQER